MGDSRRIMLITPNYHCGVVESAGRWPNLAFIYMAGELERAGHTVFIYDAMSLFHDLDAIRGTIRDFKPDVVGVTTITATVNAAMDVLLVAKEEMPDCVTMAGGVHASFCWQDMLDGFSDRLDYCVLGEGEHTVPELLEALSTGDDLETVRGIAYRHDGKPRRTVPRPFIADLDTLHPAWHLVNWSDYPLYFIEDSTVAIVSSSRGCVHACSFCSQHKFWDGSYRQRDGRKFVNEIQHLAETYGINVFFIADEYPTHDRERWELILDELIRRDLGVHILMETTVKDILRDRDILHRYREAGILFIYVGVEATSEQRLAEFQKDVKFEESRDALAAIKEAGMIVESSLILGTPDETKDTIAETLQLAYEYDADFMHFLLLAPWPYADLYDQLEPFIEDWDYAKYNLVEPVIRPKHMDRDTLMKHVLACYRSYYMRKLPEWAAMKGNDLKKSCLIRGMKAIMENSFLKDHMQGMGGMPDHVMKLINKLQV